MPEEPGTARAWDADVALSPEAAADLIERQFPALAPVALTPLGVEGRLGHREVAAVVAVLELLRNGNAGKKSADVGLHIGVLQRTGTGRLTVRADAQQHALRRGVQSRAE